VTCADLVIPKGTEVWRIYYRGGPHPMAWNEFRSAGLPSGRFDHRGPTTPTPGRKILYAARDLHTPFAECFQRTRVIDRTLDDPWLVCFALVRDVTLLDLTGPWPTRAGASLALSTGPHSRARGWSRRIYEDYPRIEGLHYPSSMHGARYATMAFYERAEDSLPALPVSHRALSDPALDGVVATAMTLFRYGA